MDSIVGGISNAFAKVVKKHRESANLSRAALARLSNLHQTYIGLLERGDRSPNVDTAKAIATALGCTLTQLIQEAETQFDAQPSKPKRKKRS